MAFSRPTLLEIFERVKVDIESGLGVVGSLLRRSVAAVLGKAVAGVAHLLFGHQVWIAKQVFPDTAESENLRRWASIYNVVQIEAEYAEGSATITGTDGTVIPEDTVLTRSDGLEYTVTADATVASGTATLLLIASEAGEDSNSDSGTVLTFESPIVNASATATVVSLSGGADQETEDALRTRLLARIARPPLGGAVQDYETWALSVAGVTRVWVEPLYNGDGTVGVFFVRDDDVSIFPDAAEILEVQEYIDSVRPIPAIVTVYAPTADTLNFNISLTPATVAVKAAVEAELEDLIFREGEPGGTILLSHIREAISTAAGETDHSLVSPTGNFVSTNGKLAVMGSITWS